MALLLSASLTTAAHYFLQLVEIAALLLCLYGLFLCAIAIHESGHWLAGVAFGFKCLEFRVGGLHWSPENSWKQQWNKSNPISGKVKMRMRDADRFLRLRYFVFILAGPVANIVAAFILYPITQRIEALDECTKLFASISLVTGIISLVPLRREKSRSDGMRMLDSIFNTREMIRIRFDVSVLDAMPAISERLTAKDWIGAKSMAEQLLLRGHDVGARDEMIKALQNIVARAERAMIRTRFSVSVSDAMPAISERLTAQDWIGVKSLVEQLLLRGRDAGARDETIRELQSIVELAEREVRASTSAAQTSPEGL
jgi:hypothetical protein